MVSRASLDQLRQANARVESLVQSEVFDLLRTVGTSSPEAAQGLLSDILPQLVNEYGEIAQVAAAEWYEATYGARAYLAPSTPTAAVQANVRYNATGLYQGDPTKALTDMAVQAVKHVRNQGRDVITTSAQRNGARWARIPRGGKTCAFCLTLASRDAVYLSERTASVSRRTGEDYHGDCRCEVVQLDRFSDYPEGYDPDAYYEIYNEAAEIAGTRNDISAIAAVMRRRNPSLLSDGVFS